MDRYDYNLWGLYRTGTCSVDDVIIVYFAPRARTYIINNFDVILLQKELEFQGKIIFEIRKPQVYKNLATIFFQ